jgi:hypothetical protein
MGSHGLTQETLSSLSGHELPLRFADVNLTTSVEFNSCKGGVCKEKDVMCKYEKYSIKETKKFKV